jgi:hypothetical protein
MRLRALVVVAGLLWPAYTHSQDGPHYFVTGNQLYESCTAPVNNKSFVCAGYVQGLTDALDVRGTICTPAGITVGQAMDVVVNYLRAHPQYRQISASLLAGAALGEAFPCK